MRERHGVRQLRQGNATARWHVRASPEPASRLPRPGHAARLAGAAGRNRAPRCCPAQMARWLFYRHERWSRRVPSRGSPRHTGGVSDALTRGHRVRHRVPTRAGITFRSWRRSTSLGARNGLSSSPPTRPQLAPRWAIVMMDQTGTLSPGRDFRVAEGARGQGKRARPAGDIPTRLTSEAAPRRRSRSRS